LPEKKFKSSYHLDSPFKSPSQPTLHDGLNSSKFKIICLNQTKKTSFFQEKFQSRILSVEKCLSDIPPEKMIVCPYEGKKYYLASPKVDRNKKSGSMMQFAQVPKIDLMYICVNGLKKELEKICCFGSLKPANVGPRLELLQSEAEKIVHIVSSQIVTIEEEGHEGKEANQCIQRSVLSVTSEQIARHITSRLWFLSRGLC